MCLLSFSPLPWVDLSTTKQYVAFSAQDSSILMMTAPFQIQTMIAPLHPTPLSFNIAIGVLGAIQSILVDTILLIRLASVYPSSYIGRTRFTALLTLPVLLKIARVVNLILFIKALADATRNPVGANLRIAQIWEHAPYLKIEWFSQLIDNT